MVGWETMLLLTKRKAYLLLAEVLADSRLQPLANFLPGHRLKVGGCKDVVDEAGELALLFRRHCDDQSVSDCPIRKAGRRV